MNDEQVTTLWLGSFRYYLGRKTYAVSDFCEMLCGKWDSLPQKTKSLIEKELKEAFAKDDELRADEVVSSIYYPLGHDCDRASWQKVLDRINEVKVNHPSTPMDRSNLNDLQRYVLDVYGSPSFKPGMNLTEEVLRGGLATQGEVEKAIAELRFLGFLPRE